MITVVVFIRLVILKNHGRILICARTIKRRLGLKLTRSREIANNGVTTNYYYL